MQSARWATLGIGLVVLLACRPRADPSAPDPDAPKPTAAPSKPPKADAGATAHPGPAVVLRGARVMTAAGVVYPQADVVMLGDRIEAVGVGMAVPQKAEVIDATGKTITPGLIDTHSHLGVYGAPELTGHSDGNETSSALTAGMRAADGYWPQDPQIERARAGGVTTMQILPGSTNLIGGRSVVVQTRPRARTVAQARLRGAPEGLKMACGENPKRTYGAKAGPVTRMGNLAMLRQAFQQAEEYRQAWRRYRDKVDRYTARAGNNGDGADGPPDPPARDLALETLAAVIEGDILVHNHCYRADEMAQMMELAEAYGFRIRSFHHAVEAYKIAGRLAEHGAAASVWADWWGFKAEAYDAVRENAAIVADAGGRAIIHSDSAIGIQHLNQEAAKAMWAGRRAGLAVSDDEALRWITANPAWALGIEGRVGTLEAGKQADVVVWSGDPFSMYAKVERVYLAGELVHDALAVPGAPDSDFELGQRAADPAMTREVRPEGAK